MKIFIIEDEDPAVERLSRMITELEPEANIVGSASSVASAVKWLQEQGMPDLIFMDINLADGLSFEIFKKIEVTSPVIFITAFDQYAIDAFKVNSIDYILKPVKKEELKNALLKFKRLKPEAPDVNKLLIQLLSNRKEYQKSRKQDCFDNI